MSKRIIAAAAVLGMGLASASASAATYINGSISFGGGFLDGALPAPPSAAIVSLLTAFGIDPAAFAFGSVGDLAGSNGPATANSWDLTPPNDETLYITAGGFTFQLLGIESVIRNGMECSAGRCDDAIIVDISGVVSGPGFDPTSFNGTFTANGSCAGTANVCTGNVTGSWSASLTAVGRAVPEPASLALLGLGLLGLGAARRRKGA